MNENIDRAYELLKKCLDHEDGDERIAFGEDSVREADLSGDITMQIVTRLTLVRAATFGGATEKALVGFSWLLAQLDENPDVLAEFSDYFSDWDVLWSYKWIVGSIYEFPHLSKSQIYEMLEDFERRAVAAGYSLHAVYMLRYRFEKFCGNRDQALEYYSRMADLPRDELSNCPTCYLNERANFAVYCGDDQRGLELLAPILQGEMKCATVPQRTFSSVLLPLIRLGRSSEALTYHRRGYAMIRQNKAFLADISRHMIFLVLIGSLESGLKIFKEHVAWLEQSHNLYHHFLFCRAACLLFEVLADQDAAQLKLRLPKTFSGYSADGLYDPRDLGKQFEQRARALADSFDNRNETDHFASELADLSNLRRLWATDECK